MLKEQLLNREDLLESLDTEPIFDYLLQHGVLDKTDVDGICNEKTAKERNSALVRHLEGNGNNAVALFINALRQSGQLHLASELDVSQRIKPIYGTGYWEKQRHKGQVTVNIHVQAVKVWVPKEESPVKKPQRPLREICEAKMTPRRLHKSYDNMLMIDGEEQSTPKPIRIVEYPYARDEEEEEEDQVKPRKSCWCMCLPMFRTKRKANKNKKYEQKVNRANSSPHPQSPARDTSGHNSHPTTPSRKKYNSPAKGSHSGDRKAPNGNSHSQTSSPFKESRLEYKNSLNERRTHHMQCNPHNKENFDPVIMRYNGNLELVELKRFSYVSTADENASPVKSKRLEMCEQWKSEGKLYTQKSHEFYELFDRDLKNTCIKYFEQERGTLILQIFSDDDGISVFNICMTKDQVTQLQNDYESEKLQKKLKTILLADGTSDHLDVLDIDVAITIDADQFDEARQELT